MYTSTARHTSSIVGTIACALAAGTASPTLAGPADDQPAALVRYSDLDLADQGGRATLERRIDMAVIQVCGQRPLNMELGRLQAWSVCRQTAWSGARRQLARLYGRSDLAQAQVRVPAGR